MPDEPVLTERRDGVLLITLNRPEARNAVNLALAEGVAAALDELDADGDLAVGVLTGAGKGFCAGMDLKAFVTGERPWVGDRGFAGIVQRAVAQAADRRDRGLRGRRRARGRAGLRPDRRRARGQARHPRGQALARRRRAARSCACRSACPYGVAMELALTGDTITAERGYELGLVNRLAEPGGAVDAALELAGAIAANGPLALDATKAILQQQFDWSEEEFWQRQGELAGPGLRLRGRARGRGRLRREARPGLAGPLALGPAVEPGFDTRAEWRARGVPPTLHDMEERLSQIVAFGGGGFSMEAGNPLLDDYVLRLTGGRAPARLLRAHGLGRRRPLRRALLPHVRGLRLRAHPPLALPPRPHRGDRRPRRAPARAGPDLRRRRHRSSACWAPGARTGSTSRWPRRGGAASCCAG